MKYHIRKTAEGTFSIYDPIHKVGCHLLCGNQRALLIDTAFGGELKEAVRRCTDLPLIVANTHVHGDHSKGNELFDQPIYVGAGDLPDADRLSAYQSLIREGTRVLRERYRFPQSLLACVNRRYVVDPTKNTYHSLPEEIDLGNRRIDVYPMPGHTEGSVIFVDEQTGTAFCGDAIAPTTWLFTDPATRIRRYAEQVESFAGSVGIQRIFPSHSRAALPFSFVGDFAKTLRDLADLPSVHIPLRWDYGAVRIATDRRSPICPIRVFYFDFQLNQ